jgi:hypothetical protein
MRVQDESNRKVGTFRGPRARRWTALLSFPDGSKEEHKTEHMEKKAATMAGVAMWKLRMREKGLAKKPTKKSHPEVRSRSKLPWRADQLDTTKGPLSEAPLSTGAGNSALSRYVEQEQRRLASLWKVAQALEGLGSDEILWILDKVTQAFNARGGAVALQTNGHGLALPAEA